MQTSGTENAELLSWLSRLSDLATFAQIAKKEEDGRYVEALAELLQTMPARAEPHGFFATPSNRIKELLSTHAFDALAIVLIPEAIDYTLSYSKKEGHIALFRRRDSQIEVILRGKSLTLLLVAGIAQMIYECRFEIINS
ncbi:hypothetical protein [Novosphingobium sp. B 225]|uniref:hypothetical protein n=1 Tax=Novosphingobium sp. B 225 TaxID=1961849 RepID=UPI000B4C1D34|nr:hypothetical protein [Novosphingobium sp. B 225]